MFIKRRTAHGDVLFATSFGWTQRSTQNANVIKGIARISNLLLEYVFLRAWLLQLEIDFIDRLSIVGECLILDPSALVDQAFLQEGETANYSVSVAGLELFKEIG